MVSKAAARLAQLMFCHEGAKVYLRVSEAPLDTLGKLHELWKADAVVGGLYGAHYVFQAKPGIVEVLAEPVDDYRLRDQGGAPERKPA